MSIVKVLMRHVVVANDGTRFELCTACASPRWMVAAHRLGDGEKVLLAMNELGRGGALKIERASITS